MGERADEQLALGRYLPGHQRPGTDAGQRHLEAVLDAVLTYLPRYVAQTRLADPGGPAVSGSFVTATLLFVDISGFTAMSERLTALGREGAEIITGIVNDYFATMLDIMARYEGDLYKFGGDALLLAFYGQDGAARGCRAALEMQQAMRRFGLVETPRGTFPLRMTAALAAGPLLLASLGEPGRLEFAVVGPTVEQVARAEDLANPGEVIVDEAALQAAGPGAEATLRAPGFYHLTALPAAPALPAGASVPDQPQNPETLLARLDAVSAYLPPEVLNRVVASSGQIMIEGEHRLVTVLFANFYGIDPAVEALGPGRADELTALLNRHFTAMAQVVGRYGGIVNKVDTYAVGYRIMALFGAPVAHEDDPVRAVRAALEMQEAMGAFAELPTTAGTLTLRQRIGINTGYVFAGNLGSPRRQEYSVMGDEVNLASRLMGLAGEGQVLVSQSTASRLGGQLALAPQPPALVKGKEQPVRFYQVRLAAGPAGEPVRDDRGHFVGRQAELGQVQALVDTALEGQGGILDLAGEAGLGKSRLVAEASAYAASRGMRTLTGEAVSYEHNLPYRPWLAVLRALLGLHAELGPQRRREQLLASLAALGLDGWAPIVGSVLGVELPETPLTLSLDPRLRQQRFFDVVLQIVQKQAAARPLLLVLDNLEWADSLSLDMVTYIARNVDVSPLLLVLVHRAEGLDAPPWNSLETVHRLCLAEMDQEPSLALARSILGRDDTGTGAEIAPALAGFIVERAQGNPLFVEEIVRSLYESGGIHRQGAGEGQHVWDLAPGTAHAEVPTTLTGLFMSRLDRLGTTSRRLLQVAAVIGSTFRPTLLARVYPYDDLGGRLEEQMTVLAERDLLLFSPPDAFAFRHSLSQEVAYQSLSFARRRELHVRAGLDLEAQHAGDRAEHYDTLARHFERGQVYDRAFVYLVQAGHKAQAEFANAAALDNYRRALDIAGEQGPAVPDLEFQVLDTLEAVGDIYLLIGRYGEAVERLERAIGRPVGSARRRADLQRKVAKAHELQGDFDRALDYLDRARRLLLDDEADRHSAEMARVHSLSGWVHMRRGETEAAAEDCRQGLAILAGLPPSRELQRDEAELYNTLGGVYVDLQGDSVQASEMYQRSTDLRRQADDLPGLARAYNNLARAAWGQGKMAEVSRWLEESLEISRQIGNYYVQASVLNNLGIVAYNRDQPEQALTYYDQALTLRRRIGDQFGLAQTKSNVGESLLALERWTETRDVLEEAARTFIALDSESELIEVYHLHALADLGGGDLEAALDYVTRTEELAGRYDRPEWRERAAALQADILARRGTP